MNEHNNLTPESSYSTGSTAPVKSPGTLIAVLLAVIILLGGMVSLLGVMNIRLFRKLNEAEPAVVFSRQAEAHGEGIGNKTPMLGIRCETVSDFMRLYYGLPKGVYVTQVLPGGAAQTAGLSAGDVIVTFSGTAVENVTELAGLVHSRQVGDYVQLTVVRAGKPYPVALVLDAEE